METNLAIVNKGIVSNIVVVDPDDQVTIDHLGGRIIDTDMRVEIGWYDDGVNFSAPPQPLITLLQAQADRLAFIESSYAAAVSADISYMGTTFQADAHSQTLITSVLVALGDTSPPGFTWWSQDNTGIQMTNADLQGLAQAILLRGQPLFAKKQTLKAAVRGAIDIQSVEEITW